MALPFYMTIEGNTQGNIEGSCNATGHEVEIQCHALDQTIQIPWNSKTGQPAGVRNHGPLKVTKAFDKASPPLYKAMIEGERLSIVELKFYRILPTGGQENYFTVSMTDATIVEIRPHMLNHFDAELARYDNMEDVSFAYAQIEWRWEPDGITAMDDMTSGA
ncbi:MAG: Hcp family type VI secretion system effector [bacterium]|nr:Hcp family type VI secretion system effector [bacterium]